jgi:hypothetical protein
VSLRTKFDNLKKVHSDSVLAQNRSELFGRRPYASSTPENPYSQSENPYGQIKTNSGITRQEGLLREDTFLRRTEGQLDEFIGRGMAVLDNLVEQKGFLKVRFVILRELLFLLFLVYCLLLLVALANPSSPLLYNLLPYCWYVTNN